MAQHSGENNLPLATESEPLPSVRPLTSGAPLRRSPKHSNLSVGNSGEIDNGGPLIPPPTRFSNAGESQSARPSASNESQKVHPRQSFQDGIDGRKSLAIPPTPSKTSVARSSLVPESGRPSVTGESTLAPQSEAQRLSIRSRLGSEQVGPDGKTSPGQTSVTSTRGSLRPESTIDPGVITATVSAADEIDIKVEVPDTTIASGSGTPPSVPSSATPTTTKAKSRPPTKGAGKKGNAGGDFGHGSNTYSSYSYDGTYEAETYQAAVPKPRKPSLKGQKQQEPQNFQQQDQSSPEQFRDNGMPAITKGMGAISFKVPRRITHKTTIKIAHYPQAGNEIISVEQPSPYGPNMDYFQEEEEYPEDGYGAGGGQCPTGNYTNNCNFATYNVTDGQHNQAPDPNAIMQMQMMQQQQAYGNPYGGHNPYNPYPYGYSPY